MNEILTLFLVFPKGEYQLSTAIAAPSVDIAQKLFALEKGYTDLESQRLQVVNLSEGLLKMGYAVDISRVGVFH